MMKNVKVLHVMDLVDPNRWHCEICEREVVYNPEQNTWTTINKGDQSLDIQHQGGVGGITMSGYVDKAE